MPVLKLVDNPNPEVTSYRFDCPGCGLMHQVWTKNPNGRPEWGFNGDLDKPTFSPSIKVSWEQFCIEKICHSYVRDGMIWFLDDCTHDLAGQTVPLPEIDT